MKSLHEASQRYADHWRSYKHLPNKKYVYRTYLPLNILTPRLASDRDNLETCGGCEKPFLSENLHQGQNENEAKKCSVCNRIDEREPKIVWLAKEEDVVEATAEIHKEQRVSIICQIHNLARSWPLDVIFIGTEDRRVYVFDITTLEEAAFDSGLRGVLESEEIEKLMFDCRENSDTLDKKHGTTLKKLLTYSF